MYLILENNRPFAIVEKERQLAVELSIKEEFSFRDANLKNDLADTNFPNWGEKMTIEYLANSWDDFEVVEGEITIIKLVAY